VFAQKNSCHVCPQSLFINIFGKIKKEKGNLYLSLRTTGKGIKRGSKKDSRGVLSNRRLIEDRPKIVDLKQRLELGDRYYNR
jgi:IS30 family transposase